MFAGLDLTTEDTEGGEKSDCCHLAAGKDVAFTENPSLNPSPMHWGGTCRYGMRLLRRGLRSE